MSTKPKYPCELCGKPVVNLKSHVKRMHGQDSSVCTVSCGQCDQTVLLSSLGKHVLEYHMEMERSISPPPSFSEMDDTNVLNKESSPAKKQSPIHNFMKLVPFTQLASKLPSPIPFTSSSSSQSLQSSLLAEDVNDNSPIRYPASDTEVASVPPCHRKQQPTLPTRKVFNTEVLVDDNQNSVLTDDTIADYVQRSDTIRRKSSENVKSKEIHFWVKTKDSDPNGQQVGTVKITMPSNKTVRLAKCSYKQKLGLENRQEELQFILKGIKLEDKECVGKLHKSCVWAEGLWYKF